MRRQSRPGRHVGALVALLAVEVASVPALVHLGRTEPFAIPWRFDAWAHAAPEDALAAAMRWVALGTCGWLLFVTIAYACLGGTRAHPRTRWSAGLIPAAIRGIVDSALAASVAIAVVANPVSAHASRDQPPVVTVVRDGRADDLRSLPTDTTALPSPVAPAVPTAVVAPDGPVAAAGSAAGVTIASDTVVVQPGDNLWEVAAGALARTHGAPRASVPDAEIAPYWIALCDTNRDRLLSRDVNLVFPGEVIELPQVS